MLQLRGSSFWGCLLSGILVPHGLATVKARETHEYKWVCKTFWQRKHHKIVVELCITVMTLVSRPTSRLKSFEGVGIYRKLSHFVLSCNRVICISWCVSNVLQKIINGKSLLMTKSARPPLLLTTAHQRIFPDSATYTPKNICSSPPADICFSCISRILYYHAILDTPPLLKLSLLDQVEFASFRRSVQYNRKPTISNSSFHLGTRSAFPPIIIWGTLIDAL